MIDIENLKTRISRSQRELIILNSKLGMLRILKSIDYYRMIEYPFAYNLLKIENHSGLKVLDIGSLDSIFPLFLASKGNSEVTATDINPRVKILERHAKRLKINNLKVEIQDATHLKYTNNYFDRITAISTIEHILPLKDGDIKAMKEIGRVLKPSGIAVITVPYEEIFLEEWRYHSRHGMYLRRGYNEDSIQNRIVKPSNLKLLDILYFCDDVGFWKIWYRYLVYFLSPMTYVLANTFLKVREKPKNAKGSIIVLTKEV